MSLVHRLMRKALRILPSMSPGAIQRLRRIRFWYIFGIFRFSGKVPYPSSIIIDPMNTCNLRCPLCPTGIRRLTSEQKMMALETFKTVIDKIPSLKQISLFNWGEPFLNPDIFKMINYARERDILVSIHTNFCFRKDEDFFLNIIDSGLNSLTISLDGASQESFSKYRVGGDFDLVITNLKNLVEVKGRTNSSLPVITWKFIVNRFNEPEIETARKMAQQLGVRFMTSPIGLSDDLVDLDFDETISERKRFWLPKDKKHMHDYYAGEYRKPLYNRPCEQLYTTMVVNPNGSVLPCCLVTVEKNAFGNIVHDSMSDIWNNEKYSYSRSFFIGKNYDGPKPHTVCVRCDNFKKKKG